VQTRRVRKWCTVPQRGQTWCRLVPDADSKGRSWGSA
jgi:hypothetical protein